MLKQIILMIVLTLLAILFQEQLKIVINWLIQFHHEVSLTLSHIFSGSDTAKIICDTLALLMIPLIIAGTAALLFLIFKRSQLPHKMTVIWGAWMVVVAALFAHGGNI